MNTERLIKYNIARHNEELRAEAALCAMEYGLDSEYLDDHDWGVVEHRHAMIYAAPSILVIYDQLLIIEPHLPCYDYRVVPAIMRVLAPYFHWFQNAGMDVVIESELAIALAKQTAGDPELHL